EHDEDPGKADRLFAKMTKVGIERFATCDREKNAAEDEQGQSGLMKENASAVNGVEGSQDRRIVADMHDAENAKHDEPDEGHRREERGDAGGAVILNQEEEHQDGNRQRNDKGLEVAVDDSQPLYSRK